MNETILAFLLWGTAYCFIKLFRSETLKKELGYSALIGVMSMYAYTVHGRGLALLCVSFFLILVLAVFRFKHRLFPVIGYIIIAIVFYGGNQIVKNYISEKFLGINLDSMTNTAENILTPTFFSMIFSSDIKEILIGMVGQCFYIFCATLGLAVVAIVCYIAVMIDFARDRRNEVKGLWAMFSTFVVGTAAATLVISTLFFANLYVTHGMVRGEYWIYGRYNEVCLGLVVFLAIIYVIKLKINRTKCVWIILLSILVGGLSYRFVIPRILELYNPDLSYTMVPGIIPFAGREIFENPELRDYVVLLLIVSSILLLLIYCIYSSKKTLMLMMVCVCFIYSITYSMSIFVSPTSLEKWNQVKELESLGNDKEFCNLSPTIYVLEMNVPIVRVPFVFPDNKVVYLDRQGKGWMELNEINENSLIISTIDEKLDMTFYDVYYVGKYDDVHVWIYGENLIDYFLVKENIIQNRESDKEKISIHRANLISPSKRTMKMSDLYKKFRYDITSDEGNILTADKAIIDSGKKISLNELYMGKGEMSIIFRGRDIINADIEFTNINMDIQEIKYQDDSQIEYIIDVYESVNDLKISISNNTKNPIIFTEMSITML